jgi:hypothetical protein
MTFGQSESLNNSFLIKKTKTENYENKILFSSIITSTIYRI